MFSFVGLYSYSQTVWMLVRSQVSVCFGLRLTPWEMCVCVCGGGGGSVGGERGGKGVGGGGGAVFAGWSKIERSNF